MKPMLVDAHRHLPRATEPDVARVDFLNYLEKYGVAVAAIHPSFQDRDFDNVGKYYEKLVAFHEGLGPAIRERLVRFGPVDFNQTPGELKETAGKFGIAGLKLHPLQEFPVEKKYLSPYLSVAAELGVPVYIHSDWVPSTSYKKRKVVLEETVGRIASLVPAVTFIMGHAGNSDSYFKIHKTLSRHPNLLLETSMAPSPGDLEKAARRFGAHRILWGSNAPFCSVAKELKTVEVLRVSLPEKMQVLGFNAARLLGIPRERLYKLRNAPLGGRGAS
ncbi:MAG: amidohydrolase family protein [Promethearchaeota archaeon]